MYAPYAEPANEAFERPKNMFVVDHNGIFTSGLGSPLYSSVSEKRSLLKKFRPFLVRNRKCISKPAWSDTTPGISPAVRSDGRPRESVLGSECTMATALETAVGQFSS